jgi:EamA domain-containing membrane protein RarD
MDVQKEENMVGTWYAISAYVAWGILPLYWKALKHLVSFSLIWVALILFTSSQVGIMKRPQPKAFP